jgi:hypothetical protein
MPQAVVGIRVGAQAEERDAAHEAEARQGKEKQKLAG